MAVACLGARGLEARPPAHGSFAVRSSVLADVHAATYCRGLEQECVCVICDAHQPRRSRRHPVADWARHYGELGEHAPQSLHRNRWRAPCEIICIRMPISNDCGEMQYFYGFFTEVPRSLPRKMF